MGHGSATNKHETQSRHIYPDRTLIYCSRLAPTTRESTHCHQRECQRLRWTAALLQKCHNGKAHNRLTVITQILGSVGNVKWKYITDCVIKIGEKKASFEHQSWVLLSSKLRLQSRAQRLLLMSFDGGGSGGFDRSRGTDS